MAFIFDQLNKILGGGAQLQKFSHATKVIGVSGSFGKASVANIIYHCLWHSGESVGWISTRGVYLNGEAIDPNFIVDNVDAAEITKVVRYFSEKHIRYLVIEITPTQSFLKVFRDITFDSVVITEMVDTDMPDIFKDKQTYYESIFQPITQITDEGLAVLNAQIKDADWIKNRAQHIAQNIYAVWCKLDQLQSLEYSLEGSKFAYLDSFVDTKLIGEIGVINTMLAMQVCVKYLSSQLIDAALTSLNQLPGRMEVVQVNPFPVVIDYGTNSSMMESVYKSLDRFVRDNRRIISVGGISGRQQKPNFKLAKTMAKYSEIVIFANNDCGDASLEDLNLKLAEMAQTEHAVLVEQFASHDEYVAVDKINLHQKMQHIFHNGDKCVMLFDQKTPHSRLDAIDFALRNAREGDLVVIFGKGEDKYLDCGKTIYEWHDVAMTKDLLTGLYTYS